ncbi:MAG: NAD(P)/FAD-dependent oxidoreductase [Chloroflexota bacterium]
MRPTGSDVVVIGGGIVGTAAAAFLNEAGARVTLIERDGLASGASGANSGVVQHPFDPVLAGLYRETLGLYGELAAADVGFRLGDEPAGLLYVSADDAAVREVDRSLAEAFPGLDRIVADGAALAAIEPAIAPGIWGCRVGIGFPVAPAASTYAYATIAERGGVRVRMGRSASLLWRGDTVAGVNVDDVPTFADAVLVAAGPWSPGLIDPTGAWRPIAERWGVVVEAELPMRPTHVLEEAEIGASIGTRTDGPVAEGTDPAETDRADFSLVPFDGVASVGSTFLAERPDPATWTERILTRASRFVPSVADAPIRGTRACARPQSLDGRPLIGAVPGTRGLFVCAGHGAWGISTGPASARLIVDEILGRRPQMPAELDPGRFGEVSPAGR